MRATRFAYAAALLFAAHLATYFIPTLRDATLATAATPAIALAVLALAQHAVVFPVVASLPAPRWACLSAYVWLIGDMTSDLLQMVGSPVSQYLTLRLIVNVLAALWIASASWSLPRAQRIIGVFVALDLVAYSLTANLGPHFFIVALPSLVLLPLWFALIGRGLARAPQHAMTAAMPEPTMADSRAAL